MTTTEQRLADALRTIDEHCQTGLNSSVYSNWSAALEDVMRASRDALAAYDAQQAEPVAAGTLSDTGKQTLETLFRELQIGTIFRPDDVRHAWAHAQMCVNAHDALVSALQACQRVLDDNGGTTPQQWIDAEAAARATLAAAGVSNA